MILRLYRGIGPGTILLSLVTGIMVWLYPFLNPTTIQNRADAFDMPLYAYTNMLIGDNPFASTILAFVFVLLIAFYISNFNTRLFFITERTLLPGALYIILSGFFINLQVLDPVLPATLLLMFCIDRLLASYRRSGISYNFFDSSLMLGLASMFYFNIIWFFLVIIIGILLIRTFNLKEIFLSIFGLLTPYLVTIAIYYIGGKDISLLFDIINNNIVSVASAYNWTNLIILLFSAGSLIVIVSLVHLARIYNTKKIRSRKIFSIFIWILVSCLAVFFIVPSASIELYYIILIPYVYIVSHFIIFVRNKKIANLIFAIIFLAIAGIQILRVIEL